MPRPFEKSCFFLAAFFVFFEPSGPAPQGPGSKKAKKKLPREAASEGSRLLRYQADNNLKFNITMLLLFQKKS